MHTLLSWCKLDFSLDGGEAAPGSLTSAAAGAVLGLAWGVAARGWMRLISETPEFTLRGTGYILGAAMAMGACAGLGLAVRRRATSGPAHLFGRALAVLPVAGLAVGPGTPMVLTALFATLALARRDWPRWAWSSAALLAFAGVLFMGGVIATIRSLPMAALGTPLYLGLLLPMIGALRIGLARPAAPIVLHGAAGSTRSFRVLPLRGGIFSRQQDSTQAR